MENATKKCPRCDAVKSVTEFGRNRARSDGLSWACKKCTRARDLAWRAANPDQREKNRQRLADLYANDQRRYLDYRYRNKWGISLKEFEEILIAQGGGCAICGERVNPDGGRLAVDHDHDCCPGKRSCGKCVRGVLCGPCNKGLGLLRDSPELLTKAIDYLTR